MISIITPCFNEEASIEFCVAACAQVMSTQLPEYDYEHIFCDNASTDNSVERLRHIAEQDPHVKVIVNSRNVGPFRNMANGMRHAIGEAVIPMLPADLQDPPNVIPKFVRSWESGHLVVYGIRKNRRESAFLRVCRGLFYRVMAWSGGPEAPPSHAGEFMLLDRRVARSINDLDDEYPYIRGLVAQTGVRYGVVPYDWGKRQQGKSRNNFSHLLDQAANAFVTTARAPMRLALIVGLVASILGVAFGLFSLVDLAINRRGTLIGIPAIIVGVFILGGLQLFFIGLIGEYILSLHGQVRRAPRMFEVERINFPADSQHERARE